MAKEDNFKGKQNTNGFTENPENINREGRPRKSFSSINESLKSQGVSPLKKQDLLDAYGLIFNSTEDELVKMAKDKSLPYAFRLIIGELNNKNTRSKALQDFRDYQFGRATENVDHTTQGKPIIINLGEGKNPNNETTN